MGALRAAFALEATVAARHANAPGLSVWDGTVAACDLRLRFFAPFSRSSFYVSEFRGHSPVTYGEEVHAAEVPWLSVAHLAIHPADDGPIIAHDHFLRLEPCIGLRANHPRQNSTTAIFPSIRVPSGAGDVSSKTVSSVSRDAKASASWAIECLVESLDHQAGCHSSAVCPARGR